MLSLNSKISCRICFTGIHGFSNSPTYEPFKKVQRGVEKIADIIEETNNENLSESEIIERLLSLATDKYQ